MNTKKHKTLFLKTLLVFIGLIFVLFSVLGEAYAETNPRVYFQTAATKVPPNSEFIIRVLVDSSQPINALEAAISYSAETLELISLNNGNSIIDFWKSGPETPAGNIINLQGGSINPFSGNGGEVIALKFRAKKEGQANLAFTKTNLYYADGKGTLAQAEPALSLKISVVHGAKTEFSPLEAEEGEDKTSPVIETAEVAKNPIDNSRLAVFHAVDSGSGLKDTQIRFRKWFSWSDWQTAANPVRLPSTAWQFQVKAADNAGNNALKTVLIPQRVLYPALPLIVLLIAVVSILRRRQRRN